MHVIATAGHVDHGKSALLKALTGMEPDRWEEEQRRGLTIDLGFVWTEGTKGPIAFVDVPGHERFVGNMLAGVGPVPAVLFVVAADEGWMPQSAEHLTALDALGVRHGLLAVTKTDLMEPELAAEEAYDHIRKTSLRDIPWVGVSARTGDGVPQLRTALDELVGRLPASDPSAPVRLWVDRGFTIRGAGLVVTGTLAAGTIRPGDTLELARTSEDYVVRDVQSMNRHVDEAVGVARVALNLRGAHRGEIGRGDALMNPGTYRCTSAIDIRTRLCAPDDLPRELLVHIGAATVDCVLRPLGADTARLRLGTPLPLRVGDRVVLRHDRGVAGGAVVLDVDPPALTRRGAGRRRAGDLQDYADAPDGSGELRRRGIVRASTLKAIGIEPPVPALTADWLVDPDLDRALRERLGALVAARVADPSAPPLRVDDAKKALDLPDTKLVTALLPAELAVRNGMIVPAEAPDTLAPAVRDSLAALERRYSKSEFTVPTEDELAALGLGKAEISAAGRAGRLVRLLPDVVLPSATVDYAVTVLAGLTQPFTVSEAREALGTTRKVIVPLLEYLATQGRTRRAPDGRHSVTGR
ncbi:MAG TPA: selenocysteine-specific translation elongation factor [Micromonosporaceae bacterium]|nr:selenocysteine-specific translation elongation factor [Micromonosporaceae bacterium]